MFESEKQELNTKVQEFCAQNSLPEIQLEWRQIPFSGEWGIAAPLFALAATIPGDNKIPVPVRAQALAQQLAEFIGQTAGIKRVQAQKGYLNFYFSNADQAKKVIDQVVDSGKAYGRTTATGKTSMVEYSQPNTHKSMHVGHLRNVILGGAVSNILEAAGHQVVRANYIGDIGLHVIKWLWNYVKYHQGEQPGEDKTRWMGDLYAEADRHFSDDPQFEAEVRAYFTRWDKQDPEVVALWQQTRQWSLEGFYQVYEQLGEHFDRIYFESEVEETGKIFVEKMIRDGFATDGRPENPVFVDLDERLGTKEEFRVAVLMRSDSTSLYATKELPLAVLKFKEYDLDQSIYVIDVRQTLHMKQIFKILELMGYQWADQLAHLAYEIVNLPGNVTMSSRDGTVVLLDDLIRESTRRARQIVDDKNPELAEKEKDEIALAVAMGAIKYPMLSRENTKVVTFDWESAMDFNGQSAPYIQYAHVRAGSILRKAGGNDYSQPEFPESMQDNEINLIETISKLPDEVRKAAKELKPSLIANYAYFLAKAFNDFYNTCPVINTDAKTRNYRLALVKASRQCLNISLALLGITAPEVM